MCLAIPAQITEVRDDRMAVVDILGVTREISLDLTPAANVGDYVLVHAGFAIEIVDEQFAQETLDLVREFPELAAEETAAPAFGAEAAGGFTMVGNPMAALADALLADEAAEREAKAADAGSDAPVAADEPVAAGTHAAASAAGASAAVSER